MKMLARGWLSHVTTSPGVAVTINPKRCHLVYHNAVEPSSWLVKFTYLRLTP